MNKVAVVTDSTACIPKEYLKQYNIGVAPLILIWGQQTFEDGVDIQPEAFYRRLATDEVMPTSSQPPVSKMQQTFSDLLDQGYSVVSIFISEKLSGTCQAAMQARDMLPSGKEKIEIMDSYSSAMCLGLQTLAVARAAADGASFAECKALAEKARAHAGLYFTVDTLEFLQRGGRIGRAQRFLGTALNLKPILVVRDGRVDADERVRTRRKSMERLVEIVVEQCAGKPAVRLAVMDANAPAEAKAVMENAASQLNVTEKIFAPLSPVIGTHTGPGTLGLAYMTEV